MAEYIERETAIRNIRGMASIIGFENPAVAIDCAVKCLERVSAADVVPAVHGEWLKTQAPLGWHDVDCVECSACHDSWIANEDYGLDFVDFWKYCPNCGARMDGDG